MTEPSTANMLAATLKCDLKAIKDQLDAGVDVNAQTAAGNTVLHAAALGVDADIVAGIQLSLL